MKKRLYSLFVALVIASQVYLPQAEASKPIGTIGQIQTITIGGVLFTDLTNLIQLYCVVASNSRATCRKTGGSGAASSGYTPSGSNKFHAMAWRITCNSSTDASMVLAQTDNDVGVNSATAFTNPRYFGGDSSAYVGWCAPNKNPPYTEGQIDFQVDNGKYLSVLNANGAHMAIWGYEIP